MSRTKTRKRRIRSRSVRRANRRAYLETPEGREYQENWKKAISQSEEFFKNNPNPSDAELTEFVKQIGNRNAVINGRLAYANQSPRSDRHWRSIINRIHAVAM